MLTPCAHPVASLRLHGCVTGPVDRQPGRTVVTAVILSCACGSYINLPRMDTTGTDAITPTSESVHVE